MIRAVTFDFWRTLLIEPFEHIERSRRLRLEGIGSVLASAGRPTPAGALEAAYDASGRVLAERAWVRQRDLSRQEQVRIFLELAAPGVTGDLRPDVFEQAVAAYSTPALRFPPVPVPGAREALTALKARGFGLAIVSNTGRTPGVVLRRVLQHHGLLDFFVADAYSDEVGYRKPHAEIFREALRRVGAEPEEALHVGDDPVADVAGARAIGMRTCHFAAGAKDGAPEADLVLADLADLPDRLAALSATARRGF